MTARPKLSTVYRLAPADVLPLHWCYCDPFDDVYDDELDDVVRIDNRAEGFQVWADLAAVLDALKGNDHDGYYEPAEYPRLLVIRVRGDLSDGCGEWWAARHDQIVSVRAIDSARVAQLSERKARALIRECATTITPALVETLPEAA